MRGVPAVGGREAQRPPGLALVVGVLDVVVGLVDLARAGGRVARRAVVLAEAPDVHAPEVERRLAADDPLGHHLADAAGAGQPVRAESGGHEQPAHGGLAEAELAVGRERLRAVDQPRHAHASKSGTRLRALTTISSKRSQSSSSRRPLKSGGMWSRPTPIDHGAQVRS